MKVNDLIISKNLKYLRKSNKYSIKKMAELFDIDENILIEYEKSKKRIPTNFVLKVAEHFKLDITTIYTKDLELANKLNKKKDYISVEQTINEIKRIVDISNMSSSEKKALISILEYIRENNK